MTVLPKTTGIYAPKERVKILKEVRADYLIEDIDTGRQYLIDKTYFHRKYSRLGGHGTWDEKS